jgi:hypothetical protein
VNQDDSLRTDGGLDRAVLGRFHAFGGCWLRPADIG